MPVDDSSGSRLPQLMDSDRVVGVCSQRVKVLHTMATELKERIDDYRICLEGEDADSKSERHMKWRGESYLLKRKLKVLENLLVIFIHEDVPELVTKSVVVIRRGWQLCYVDEGKVDEVLKKASDLVCAVLMTKAGSAGSEFGNN